MKSEKYELHFSYQNTNLYFSFYNFSFLILTNATILCSHQINQYTYRWPTE